MRKIALMMFALVAINIAMSSIYPVAAYIYTPELKQQKHGSIWYFTGTDPYEFDPYFDVSTLTITECKYLPIGGTEYDWVTVTPKETWIDSATNTIYFYFSPKDIPKGADSNVVTGTLPSGDTVVATGPGWLWGKRG